MRGLSDEEVADLVYRADYNPTTGEFTRRISFYDDYPIGSRYESIKDTNRLIVVCLGRTVLAHIAAWRLRHGVNPNKEIDHINGIQWDNRIYNLRLATRKENMQNYSKYKNNSTGLLGVSKREWKSGATYRARIMFDGKEIGLGTYSNPEDAHKAYVAGKRVYHTFNPELIR